MIHIHNKVSPECVCVCDTFVVDWVIISWALAFVEFGPVLVGR